MQTIPLTMATSQEQAVTAPGEYRAGGTDVQDRRRSDLSPGPLVDIHRLPGLNQIDWQDDGSAVIGALVTIDTLANDPAVQKAYPGLAQAAGGLATPQIRLMGTLGGGLLQRTRCPYFRHPAYSCFKTGGDGCHARDGHNPNGVVFDLGPCVYPHPSTLGVALLAYEASVALSDGTNLSAADLFGDGSDPTRDNVLEPAQLLTHVHLPPPVAGEKTAYFRSISRAEAEWPIVECLVRLKVEAGLITLARVGVGGVANIPLRLPAVEAALENHSPDSTLFEKAAQIAAEGVNPLPQTAAKVAFLVGTVGHTLQEVES